MANIVDNLNILDQKLDAARTKLAANLTNKGVPSSATDTLDAMADKVAEIKMPPTVRVELSDNWHYAPGNETPNPDRTKYEGVFESFHRGVTNLRDKMIIHFSGMPNFTIYIRSNAEATFDYAYAGKIDETEPTEFITTKGNQQAGTDLSSYTKGTYTNDGGEHFVVVVYRKDGSNSAGLDRGYVFFSKPTVIK